MADFNLYFPTLLKLEGGLSNDPKDKGGLTKYGITLKEWIRNGRDINGDGIIDGKDLKLITIEDAAKIAKPNYWDIIKGDQIDSQSLAEFICDWAYNSGTVSTIKKVQEVIGTTSDGIMGKQSLKILNTGDKQFLFNNLKGRREQFFLNIVKGDPSQEKFLKGWLNRNNSFKFKG